MLARLQDDGTDELHEIVEDAEEKVPGVREHSIEPGIDGDELEGNELLREENVFLNQQFANKEEAIRFAGRALVNAGYVKESYIEAMIARDELTSTYGE